MKNTMDAHPPPSSRLTQPGAYSAVLALFWTVAVALSIAVNLAGNKREMVSIAENIARASIDKDLLFREWVAMHGGIYVPVSDATVPNPHIPHAIVPERDITTPSGRRLTFVNPAYLTRQIYDLSQKSKHISGRITSLKPLSPQNKPDAWEAHALQSFEKGRREFSMLVPEGNERYLRLMRPLMTEESCLPCHQHQGYKTGDVRGGISIKLPMRLFETAIHKQTGLLWAGHVTLWFLGLAGLYAGYRGLTRRTGERDRAEKELHRVNAILESKAETDFLTGIANRRKFLAVLETEIIEAKRYGIPLAVIFFDIDHFKRINDDHGHQAGDQVLRELAHVVGNTIRHTDIFARFGGEEFTILVHDNDVRTGRDLAEKIRQNIERHEFPATGAVTCSFGVAQFYEDDCVETIIKRADEAMYAAKQLGRNRVETRCDYR